MRREEENWTDKSSSLTSAESTTLCLKIIRPCLRARAHARAQTRCRSRLWNGENDEELIILIRIINSEE